MRDTEVVRRQTVLLRRLVDPRSVRVPDQAIEARVLHHDHEHVLEVLQILARVRPGRTGRTCQHRQPNHRSQPANSPAAALAADPPAHHDSLLRMTKGSPKNQLPATPKPLFRHTSGPGCHPLGRGQTSGSRSYGAPLQWSVISLLPLAAVEACRLNPVAAWKITLGRASRTPGRRSRRS
jgi:hypothetical protein